MRNIDEGGVRMKNLIVIFLVVCLVPMLACSPLENEARDTAAALGGSIAAAQTRYQAACAANPSQQICQVINRGVSAQNALITAVETYCGWSTAAAPPDANTKCVPVKSTENVLRAAIANAAALTAQIKGAI